MFTFETKKRTPTPLHPKIEAFSAKAKLQAEKFKEAKSRFS
jgi:hypothetical protein